MRFSQVTHKKLWLDPRTKIFLLLISVLAAAMAPRLLYELGLVILIAILAFICGKAKAAAWGIALYLLFYFITTAAVTYASASAQAVLLAFLGLLHKVFPCAFIGIIITGTTKISEFLTAMNRIHAPKSIMIPLAVMLRYIPTIQEDWHYIKDAMRLRDVSPNIRGLLTRPAATLECVYVPLMMAASKASDELSIASVTRGIENPVPRTCFTEIRFHIADFIAAAGFLAYFLGGYFL